LHPDHPERGFREYTVEPKGSEHSTVFWVSKKDVYSSKIGNVIRLMELFNLRIKDTSMYSAEASFASESYEEARNAKAQLIHWIQLGDDMPSQIVMPDATQTEGIAEKACKQLKPNTIIQFERFGFVRIDNVDTKLIAYYAHK
jgi:glutamyl-tRNA synthetase